MIYLIMRIVVVICGYYIHFLFACSTIMDLVSKLSMKTINNVQLNIIAMLFAGITNASIQFAQERTFGLQKLKKPKIENVNNIEILNKYPIISVIGAIKH